MATPSSSPSTKAARPAASPSISPGRTPQVSFIGVDPTDPDDLVFDFGSLHQITNTDRELYFYADYEHELELGRGQRDPDRRQIYRP